MPRIIDNLNFETEYALETIQRTENTIILRNAIEKEISRHPGKYPNPGNLKNVPIKMVMTSVVNRIPGTKVYHKRLACRIISDFGSGEATYG